MSKRLKKLTILNEKKNEYLRNLERVRCEQDVIYWINNFCWTYDPRLDIKFIPIILFPLQEKCIKFILHHQEEGNDWIVEKSRDMGVTWLCVYIATSKFLFEDGSQSAFGSRKEELVDKLGDTKSIFEKIRQNLYKQPSFLMPIGFKRKQHDGSMKLINPETGATITGEAGDNMGRGGRTGDYYIDEAAYIERPEKVDAALSETAKSRGYVSTPNGNGNLFFRKVQAGTIPVFTMHWKNDPRKNIVEIITDEHGNDKTIYPWYEKKKIKLFDPVIIAQELDIDYAASIEGIIIPVHWVDAAVGFDKWLKSEFNLELPEGDHECGYDVAEEGGNYNVAMFRNGPRVYAIESWNYLDTYLSAEKIALLCNTRKVDMLNFDAVGVGAAITGDLKSSGISVQFTINPINVGGKVTNRKWYEDKRSKELFSNLKAEMWWIAREKFYKTYEYRELGIKHDLKDLVSIPDHKILRQELSTVKCRKLENGKIQIETKKELKDRGILSPDYADAYVLSVTPKKPRDNEDFAMSSAQVG